MRLAKGFFLPLIAAGMRSKFCRSASNGIPTILLRVPAIPPEVLRYTFCEYEFIFSFFNLRRTSNSRMRLAKGFFLSLIAAGMRSKFGRPASDGVPAIPLEVLRDAFCEYKFIFHLF